MTKEEMLKKINEELDEIYSFISADENQSFGFSLSQAKDDAGRLEKIKKKLEKKL